MSISHLVFAKYKGIAEELDHKISVANRKSMPPMIKLLLNTYRIYPNKRRGRLLTQRPPRGALIRGGGAYSGGGA